MDQKTEENTIEYREKRQKVPQKQTFVKYP